VPIVVDRRRLLAQAVRTLSQFRVNYRDSVLSRDTTPWPGRGLRAGDRLPDATVVCDGRTVRLHELTATPGVHLLLSRDADPYDASPLVRVHRLTSRPGAGIVAVRPDGHIGFRSDHSAPAQLTTWLNLIAAR
jgi:hypothetical protein